MENLLLPATEGNFATPRISFDLDTRIFEMEGESFLEDTDSFYNMLLVWLQEFIETYEGKLVFNFKFFYYNSSSSKCILKIFKQLKQYQDSKGKVEINWYYPEGNEDLQQEGEDFAEAVAMQASFFVMQ